MRLLPLQGFQRLHQGGGGGAVAAQLRDGVVVGILTGDAVTTEDLLAQIAGGTR